MKKRDQQGLLEPFCNEVYPWQYTRSQDLPETVFCDGYVDITRVPIIKKHRQVVAGKIFGLHRQKKIFLDLDEEQDLLYAEFLMKKFKNGDKDGN